MAPVRKCYDDGHCYDEYTDPWHIWGRWVLLGVLVFFVIFMIPFSGYLMSLRRMRRGMQPVPGCAWMFPNPYKHAKTQRQDSDEVQLTQRQPRYKPYDPYIQHQRELMLQNEQMRAQAKGMKGAFSSTDLETGGETEQSFDEKPSRP